MRRLKTIQGIKKCYWNFSPPVFSAHSGKLKGLTSVLGHKHEKLLPLLSKELPIHIDDEEFFTGSTCSP